MFKLEQAIQTWKRQLRSSPAFEDGDIAELESHLRDEIERLKTEGFSEEEAFQKASEEIGEPESIGDELFKSRTVKPDPTPPWKKAAWFSSLIPNYIKITVRNLSRRKAYSAINIIGLSIGLAVVLLLFNFVQFEKSYDRFHERADDIYRITEIIKESNQVIEASSSIPMPYGSSFATAYPNYEVVRIYRLWGKDPLIGNVETNNNFYEPDFLFADSTFFNVFSFSLMEGDPDEVLDKPYSVVITESAAKKYFGDESPIGKILRFENKMDYTIRGLVEDPPSNSHFNFDFIATFQNYEEIKEASGTGFDDDGWYWNPAHTYVLAHPGHTVEQLNGTLEDFTVSHGPDYYRSDSWHFSFSAQKLTDIHLTSNLAQELQQNSSTNTINFSIIIAIIILAVAIINYVNLTTVSAIRRSKEIGIRKSFGASSKSIIVQYLSESLIMTLVSFLIAMGALIFLRPVFFEITGVMLPLELIFNAEMVGYLILLWISVGLLSGTYPALILSRFKPHSAIKNTTSNPEAEGARLRKVLVIFQFTAAITLLICTIGVFQQFQFLLNKDLGYKTEGVIIVPVRGTEVVSRTDTFREQLVQNPDILNATAVSSLPGKGAPITPVRFEGIDNLINIASLDVDYHFFETFKVQRLEGRYFSQEIQQDSHTVVLNKKALELFPKNWAEQYVEGSNDEMVPIVGLTKDIHYSSLYSDISPLLFRIHEDNDSKNYLAIRINSSNIFNTLAEIEEVWQEFVFERPLTYSFLEQNLEDQYRKEETASAQFASFSILAILVSCLGLFGLASFATAQRTKEIGIRKVLGASIPDIIVLFSKDFAMLVFIAILLSAPIGYYIMSRWLENFAFKIDLSPGIIAIAGGMALTVALLTVSSQLIKVALMNPVKTLRSE